MTKLYALLITLFLLMGCAKKQDTPAPVPPTVTPTKASGDKTIIEFKFLKSVNTQLDKDYAGTISGANITVDLPYGFAKTALISSFQISAKATVSVGSAAQVSGQTANDFTQTVTYSITAEDKTMANYEVKLHAIGIAPNPNINQTTSYYYRINATSWIDYNKDMPSSLNFYYGGYLARAVYDFDKDGDEDIMMGNLSFDGNGQLLNTPRPVNYIQNNGGTYTDKTAQVFTTNIPGQVHPRKAIIGDFDKNGWMDVVFAGHGFDSPPYPGEQALIMMNTNGKFTSSYLSPGGFFHSVCSGDIDNDGDIDLFFTDTKGQLKFFTNNGSGQFTYDSSIAPADVTNVNYYTSELYDLNNDGYLDLVVSGHQHENAVPTVFWGNYSGKYAKDRSTTLPAVAGWGIGIDINLLDLNGDGLTDIILNRQGDGTASQKLFYGLYVQVLMQQTNKTFSDNTSSAIQGNTVLTYPQVDWFWVDWLRVYDFDNDGKKDIVVENKNFNIKWKNTNSVLIKQ